MLSFKNRVVKLWGKRSEQNNAMESIGNIKCSTNVKTCKKLKVN